jgi:dipeptidyl-peptidase-4
MRATTPHDTTKLHGRIDLRLVSAANARAHPGIAEVIWGVGGETLFFNLQGQLFRIAADGSALTKLTESPGVRRSIALSPDGQILSFLQGGNLWFLSLDSGALREMTDTAVLGAPRGTMRAEFVSYHWSPDGRHIALLFVDRRNTRTILIPDYMSDETTVTPILRGYAGDAEDVLHSIWIYETGDGDIRSVPLTSAHRLIENYRWSPDGLYLLVDQSSFDGVNRSIHLIAPEDMLVQQLWHDVRATRTAPLWDSAWQSDGDGILFITNVDGWYHLYVKPIGGVETQLLTPGNFSVVAAAGSARLSIASATQEVFFVSTRESPYERQVYRVSEAGGPVTQVTTLPGVHVPSVAPDGATLAVLRSSDITPTELYLVDLQEQGVERRITHSPPEVFDTYPWTEPRYVTFDSRVDGATLHGRLLLPRDLDRTKKYPVILGPVYRDTVRNRWRERFSLLEQYLALEGQYISFQVDVRGSTAYGRDFEEGILKRYGQIDIEDLHSGVEYLKTLPYVDHDRIGIWGHSYGGLLTVSSVFKKPGVYRVAIAGAPATNAWHMPPFITTRARDPVSAGESYLEGSPISHGEALQDRLLIIHGTQDQGNLFKDSVVLAEKLMLLGKNFDMVLVPSAGHAWFLRDYQAYYTFTKIVEYFDRYLGRGPRPGSAADR